MHSVRIHFQKCFIVINVFLKVIKLYSTTSEKENSNGNNNPPKEENRDDIGN